MMSKVSRDIYAEVIDALAEVYMLSERRKPLLKRSHKRSHF